MRQSRIEGTGQFFGIVMASGLLILLVPCTASAQSLFGLGTSVDSIRSKRAHSLATERAKAVDQERSRGLQEAQAALAKYRTMVERIGGYENLYGWDDQEYLGRQGANVAAHLSKLFPGAVEAHDLAPLLATDGTRDDVSQADLVPRINESLALYRQGREDLTGLIAEYQEKGPLEPWRQDRRDPRHSKIIAQRQKNQFLGLYVAAALDGKFEWWKEAEG